MPILRCEPELEDESSGTDSGDRFEGKGDTSWGVWMGFSNRSRTKLKGKAGSGFEILANKRSSIINRLLGT